MPKQPTTKQRTKVKDLPKNGKKLSKGDMKKVKGGSLTPDAELDAGGYKLRPELAGNIKTGRGTK